MSAAPGRDKRQPRRSDYNWSLRAPLARWLEREGGGAAGLRVVDVGCGDKPYAPYFSAASEYVGVDPANATAEVQARAEQLPFEDESFDLALCIQVLEHVDDPAAAIRELHRVVRPGGRVLASTHGTYVYHPDPGDHWRWTTTGLERLFRENGAWSGVSIKGGAGTSSALALLNGHYLELVAKRLHAVWAGRPLVWTMNTLAAALDRRVPSLREPIPGSLAVNFHIVAAR